VQVGQEVGDLLVVLQAREHHLGAGHQAFRGLDVLGDRLVLPDDAGVLEGVRIPEILEAAGLAAEDVDQMRPDRVLGLVDRVTGLALGVHLLALFRIALGLGGASAREQKTSHRQGDAPSDPSHGVPPKVVHGPARPPAAA
jgi:hypothetical protein